MTGCAPHILVVNVFFAPFTYGGATQVAEQVAINLVNHHGCRVSVFSAMSRPEFSAYSIMKAEKDGIINHIVNLPQRLSWCEKYNNPKVTKSFLSVVEELDPDIVHFHCIQDLGADLITTCKELGKIVVLSIHDFWWLCERQFMIKADGRYCAQDPIRVESCADCVLDFQKTRQRLHFLASQATAVDMITYPSEFAKSLYERSGFLPGRGVVWKNGIIPPLNSFWEKQARRRSLDSRITFGYVGGPSPIKGWPIIHDTFRSIERSNFKGILVDASLSQSWYTPASYSEFKGDWTVRRRYDSKSIDDFYADIDVLLFLSQWKETFGLTIREALCRGIHVIQTDSGGTMEHEGIEQVSLLKIGERSDKVIEIVTDLLDNPEKTQVAPVKCRSYHDQANEFVDLLERIQLLKTRGSFRTH